MEAKKGTIDSKMVLGFLYLLEENATAEGAVEVL